MELEELSREDLISLVKMMKEGKPVEEAEASFVPKEIITIAETLHSLLCGKPHGEGFGCSFYTTKDNTNPDRAEYMAMAKEAVDDYGIQATRDAIYAVISVLQILKTSLPKAPEARASAEELATTFLLLYLNQSHYQSPSTQAQIDGGKLPYPECLVVQELDSSS